MGNKLEIHIYDTNDISRHKEVMADVLAVVYLYRRH